MSHLTSSNSCSVCYNCFVYERCVIRLVFFWHADGVEGGGAGKNKFPRHSQERMYFYMAIHMVVVCPKPIQLVWSNEISMESGEVTHNEKNDFLLHRICWFKGVCLWQTACRAINNPSDSIWTNLISNMQQFTYLRLIGTVNKPQISQIWMWNLYQEI